MGRISGFGAVCHLSDIREVSGSMLKVWFKGKTLSYSQESKLQFFTNILHIAQVLHGVDASHTGDIHDISEAISAYEKSLELIPERHTYLPLTLVALSDGLYARSVLTGNREDFDACISHLNRAATCGFGHVGYRFRSAERWSRLLLQDIPESPEVLYAFEVAISLMSLIGGLNLPIHLRHACLREISGLTRDAAASALSQANSAKALEWLEHGRCLVWNQINHLRTPLHDLRAVDSELAQRVSDVSNKLERAGASHSMIRLDTPSSARVSMEDEALEHVQHADEWETLLRTVREIPGFETFLQPATRSTLLSQLPSSGTVIVITASETRCDAVALSKSLGGPLHIPLTGFSLQKANDCSVLLRTHLKTMGLRIRSGTDPRDEIAENERALGRYKTSRSQASDPIHEIVGGLWRGVVKPIVDILGLLEPSDRLQNMVPRIWWCPTGPFAFLPLHAAGCYVGPQAEGVMDYVVSSYTPTITALIQRVQANSKTDSSASGLLLTSQPQAPGASKISGTTKEVRAIHEEATERGIRALKIEGDELCPEECLKYLEQFSSIHLACHASQNVTQPLQSRFLFHRGALDLATIIQSDLKNADLAFLSACQTSTGEDSLPDEAVHLAAGMLSAGYRRVVATMWAIGDQHAPDLATDFYGYLWDHREERSGSHFDGSLSAHALRHATVNLKERLKVSDPERSLHAWIPYVHFGY